MCAAPKGNDYNLKYTLEEAKQIMEKMIKYATDTDDCLCVQDAILYADIPRRSYYYINEKFEKDLHSYKRSLNDIVIARVNKGAIKSVYNSTACIWRMKQLGESDKQEIDHTSKGEKIEAPSSFVFLGNEQVSKKNDEETEERV